MSRFFRRKKKDEKTAEPAPKPKKEAVTEEEAVEEPAAVEVVEPPPDGRGDTIPYHDSIQDRLVYMLNDAKMAEGLEGTHEFILEFMAMGERFWIGKAALGEIETKVGKAADEDAHIRIASDTVSDLLSVSTCSEFSKIYLQHYKRLREQSQYQCCYIADK